MFWFSQIVHSLSVNQVGELYVLMGLPVSANHHNIISSTLHQTLCHICT